MPDGDGEGGESVELEDVYPPEQPKGAAPKEKLPEKPENPEKKEQQMPKDKPMKIKSSDLDSVILIPKGYQGQYPVAQAANEEMLKQQEELSKVKDQVAELSKQLEEKDKKIAELSKGIEDRETKDRQDIASEVVDLKLSAGVVSFDEDEAKAKAQKEEAVKELSKLGVDQLKVLRTEIKTLSKKPEGESQAARSEVFTPGTSQHKELSSTTVKKAELRKEMFGHEKPLGEEE